MLVKQPTNTSYPQIISSTESADSEEILQMSCKRYELARADLTLAQAKMKIALQNLKLAQQYTAFAQQGLDNIRTELSDLKLTNINQVHLHQEILDSLTMSEYDLNTVKSNFNHTPDPTKVKENQFARNFSKPDLILPAYSSTSSRKASEPSSEHIEEKVLKLASLQDKAPENTKNIPSLGVNNSSLLDNKDHSMEPISEATTTSEEQPVVVPDNSASATTIASQQQNITIPESSSDIPIKDEKLGVLQQADQTKVSDSSKDQSISATVRALTTMDSIKQNGQSEQTIKPVDSIPSTLTTASIRLNPTVEPFKPSFSKILKDSSTNSPNSTTTTKTQTQDKPVTDSKYEAKSTTLNHPAPLTKPQAPAKLTSGSKFEAKSPSSWTTQTKKFQTTPSANGVQPPNFGNTVLITLDKLGGIGPKRIRILLQEIGINHKKVVNIIMKENDRANLIVDKYYAKEFREILKGPNNLSFTTLN